MSQLREPVLTCYRCPEASKVTSSISPRRHHYIRARDENAVGRYR